MYSKKVTICTYRGNFFLSFRKFYLCFEVRIGHAELVLEFSDRGQDRRTLTLILLLANQKEGYVHQVQLPCPIRIKDIQTRAENLSPAMGRGINSRNRVWNSVAKLVLRQNVASLNVYVTKRKCY
jgi:hypothetical protein